MKKKELDSPEKIKTSLEELEVLTRLQDSVEWAIVKRLALRYIHNLMRVSFKLIESNPDFRDRHAELAGQALGIKMLIRMIDNAGKKKEQMEEKKNV